MDVRQESVFELGGPGSGLQFVTDSPSSSSSCLCYNLSVPKESGQRRVYLSLRYPLLRRSRSCPGRMSVDYCSRCDPASEILATNQDWKDISEKSGPDLRSSALCRSYCVPQHCVASQTFTSAARIKIPQPRDFRPIQWPTIPVRPTSSTRLLRMLCIPAVIAFPFSHYCKVEPFLP